MKLKPDSNIFALMFILIIVIAKIIIYAFDNTLQLALVGAYYWITGIFFIWGIFHIFFAILSAVMRETSKIYIIIILIGCLHIPYLLNIGSTQIGDLYEKGEYSAVYYVYMSESPQDSGKRTVYKLPARIERSDHSDTYHIYRLFFSNGGYLEFNEINNDILLDKEVKLMDTKHEYYYITLTRNKYKY